MARSTSKPSTPPLSNRRPSMGSAPRSFSPGQGLATPNKRIIHVFWHVIWHIIIHVIRDNAACHKGPDVRAFLARPDCRIHLVQLPPYCPHINPIERLSALIHQHVTHNRHDPTQKQFANAILGFLRETIPNEWKTFPSQAEAKYQTTFASQQSKNMRNFGFSGNRSIEVLFSLCWRDVSDRAEQTAVVEPIDATAQEASA